MKILQELLEILIIAIVILISFGIGALFLRINVEYALTASAGTAYILGYAIAGVKYGWKYA